MVLKHNTKNIKSTKISVPRCNTQICVLGIGKIHCIYFEAYKFIRTAINPYS